MEIDGQRVSTNGDGVLFIDDPLSLYNGMPVEAYQQFVVKPFLTQRGARLRAIDRKNLPPWPDAVPKPKAGKVNK